MCCLFGFHDYGHKLTRKQRATLLKTLATACEERGTDATGIAYNVNHVQHICKRPLAAHKMWFRVPAEATVVMGHTRMTTQGSERKNWNNHPFPGKAGNRAFAMAHNGVLNNDKHLRKKFRLPATRIETDSYIAVQLVENFGTLGFPGLQHMAEQLEGSFTITALSDRDELYFIKGNNPMCLFHFPKLGLYVYASTEQILRRALTLLPFSLGDHDEVQLFSGDMLCIDAKGKQSRGTFDNSKIDFGPLWSWSGMERKYRSFWGEVANEDSEYLEDLKAVACSLGLYPEDIDEMLLEGITPEEIEEYLYGG